MSLLAVARSADRRERPIVNATIEPAFLTVVGYATPSRIVSSAVTCVRMIVQFAGETPAGHDGATSGVEVAPSSMTCAEAEAGATAAPSAAAATTGKQIRFIAGIETRVRSRSCACRKTTANGVGAVSANGARFAGRCGG